MVENGQHLDVDAEIQNAEQEQQNSEPQNVFEYFFLINSQDIVETAGVCADFKIHSAKVDSIAQRATDLARERISRLVSTNKEVVDRIDELGSQTTISTVYLKMVEELSSVCMPTEILKFFKDCLKYNDMFTQSYIGKSNDLKHREALASPIDFNARKKDILKSIGGPPSWFEGDEDSWIEFVDLRRHFKVYLAKGEDLQIIKSAKGINAYDLKGGTKGPTLKSARPEWFESDEEEVPDINNVKKDLSELEEELSALMQMYSEIGTNTSRLQENHNRRWIKSFSHFEILRRELEKKNTSLINTAIYLGVTKKTQEFPDLESLSQEVLRGEIFNAMSPEESQERVIEDFTKKHFSDTQTLSFWLEDKMKRVKLPVDLPTVKEIVAFLLTEPSSADLYSLKERNKSYHNLIKYDIFPLFSELGKDEKNFLGELLQISESPFEIIEELSSIFSNHLKSTKGEKLSKVILDIKKFTKHWLKTTNIEEMLSIVRGFHSLESDNFNEPLQIQQEIDEMDKEVTVEEDEAKKVVLTNWNVFLIHDYDITHLSEPLSGATSDDLIKSLEYRFDEEHLSYSIKTSSIIRALEWFVSMPESAKHLWMKQEIDGVTYYKIKRGAVRIFCHIDQGSRKVLFFPYQKKSMEYRFHS